MLQMNWEKSSDFFLRLWEKGVHPVGMRGPSESVMKAYTERQESKLIGEATKQKAETDKLGKRPRYRYSDRLRRMSNDEAPNLGKALLLGR